MSDPDGDPLARARRLAAPPRQRRFYAKAEMAPEPGGFALRLDGKQALTPGRKPFAVPRADIAEAVADEWMRQGEFIDPQTMPVTRLANSAIDGVADRLVESRAPILAYAASDLVCYRAGEPDGLVRRQREAWDPIVGWAERNFGGRLILSEGIVHVAQPSATLEGVGRALNAFDEPFTLAALNLATTLSGSALIALALADGLLPVEAAWGAAHVDEDWNIAQWGEDADAKARRARRYEDFRAAALVLSQRTQA